MTPHEIGVIPTVGLDVGGTRWRVDPSAHGRAATVLASELRRLWSRSAADPAGDTPVLEVVPPELEASASKGVARIVAPADRTSFPYAFSRALTRLTIEQRAGSALMLHAAALASADGQRAAVLVAPSGTGKSTAARALGRGFGYLTDELTVIERDLTVSPYPKPISVVATDRPGDKDEWSADELGLGPTPSRRPDLAAMVLLDRDPQRSMPALTRAGLVDALLELIGQSSSIWLLDRPLQQLTRAATRGGGPYVLTYSEISSCREIVGGLLEGGGRHSVPRLAGATPANHPPAGSERWSESTPGDDHVGRPIRDLSSARFARAPWTDAVEVDGEVVLLLGPQPARLSGLGATIWLAAREPITIGALVDVAVRVHGPHPDAARLISDVVTQALEANVLRGDQGGL